MKAEFTIRVKLTLKYLKKRVSALQTAIDSMQIIFKKLNILFTGVEKAVRKSLADLTCLFFSTTGTKVFDTSVSF